MGKEQDLLDAAKNGDVDNIEKILGHKSKKFNFTSSSRGDKIANYQDSNGYTAIHHASLNGHKLAVEALLLHNASANIMDSQGCYPLHLAAWAGNTDVCKTLMTHGPSVAGANQLSKNNETSLLIAAQNGHTNTVSILLEHHGDPTILNSKFESSLDLASQYGRLETVQLLVRRSPSLLTPTNEELSALHLASRNGHHKVVQLLLDSGCDINTKKISGSALHEAALFGKGDIVQELIQRGIDLTISDSEGRTVLDLLRQHPTRTANSMDILHDIEEYFRRGKQKLLGQNNEKENDNTEAQYNSVDSEDSTYICMGSNDYDVPSSMLGGNDAPHPVMGDNDAPHPVMGDNDAPHPVMGGNDAPHPVIGDNDTLCPVIAPTPATRYSLLKALDPLCSDKDEDQSTSTSDGTYEVPMVTIPEEKQTLSEYVVTGTVSEVAEEVQSPEQISVPVVPPRKRSIIKAIADPDNADNLSGEPATNENESDTNEHSPKKKKVPTATLR